VLSNGTTSPNHISGGAIAGIVIGVVAVIAIAGLAAVLFLRSRQRKQNYSKQLTRSQNNHQPVEELRTHLDHVPQEMQAISIKPVELPDLRTR
jgi:uncharacterized protein HemX